MTKTVNAQILEHPLYREAQAHLQRAQWKEALRCLDGLRAAFPGHLELQALQEEAHLKARADSRLPRRRLISRLPWRRLVSLFLLGVILVGSYVIGVTAFQEQIEPQLERNQRTAQIETSIRQGQLALARLDYAEAIRQFEIARTLAPEDERAQDGLHQAERDKELARQYQEAEALVKAERWLEAYSALTALAEIEPGYRDVDALLHKVARQSDVARAFLAAEESFQAGAWRQAITHYETVRALDSTYERNTVILHLSRCYLEVARDLVAQVGTNDAAAAEAINYFNKALTLEPHNPEAMADRQDIENYVEAVELVQVEDWENAIPRLEALRAMRPGYAHGKVAGWLFRAYLLTGDQAAKAGDFELAEERYELLLQLTQETGNPNVAQLFNMFLFAGDAAAQSQDYPLALFYYEAALKVAQALGPDAHLPLAELRARMADAAMENGNPETAVPYYRQAVMLALRESGEADRDQVHVYLGRAEEAVSHKQYVAAAEEFKGALKAALGE